MVEIKEDILKVLSGLKVWISKLPISEEKKFSDSPLRSTVIINCGKKKGGSEKCFFCDNPNFDWCSNCGRPICEEHAYAIILPYGVIFNVCKECRDEIITLYEKEKMRENVLGD